MDNPNLTNQPTDRTRLIQRDAQFVRHAAQSVGVSDLSLRVAKMIDRQPGERVTVVIERAGNYWDVIVTAAKTNTPGATTSAPDTPGTSGDG